MPRKPEPSFEMKKRIWEIAATVGKDNLVQIQRQLDHELWKAEIREDTPDIRTIKRIVREINDLPQQIVVAKLPAHVWLLRDDYETIKQLVKGGTTGQAGVVDKAEKMPYQETPHKRKMREMAAKVASTLDLPSAFDSFIVELKPGRLFLRHSRLPINISETGELEVEIRFEGHLYEGLHNHLNTGGFSKVLDQIESWKEEVAGNLLACHKLFTLVKAEVEESYNASIPMDYQGQPGFTPWFPITICGDAIEQARGVTYITDSWYKYEGSDLRCGAFLIYKGTPDEDLGVYRNAHIALRAKYAEDEQAKERARQRDLLYQIRDKIGQELQKFIDMEHLPGQCELCFHSSS